MISSVAQHGPMDSTIPLPNGESPPQPHILIIGAGITGLVLAQALRKRHSASSSRQTPNFSIFERDPTPSFRGAGWGLTIHWALDDFVSLLPQYLVDRLPETYVDADAVERGETGNFLLYDLQSGKDKYRVPPNARIRVSRERLRSLLMDGLDIEVRSLTCFVLAMFSAVWVLIECLVWYSGRRNSLP